MARNVAWGDRPGPSPRFHLLPFFRGGPPLSPPASGGQGARGRTRPSVGPARRSVRGAGGRRFPPLRGVELVPARLRVAPQPRVLALPARVWGWRWRALVRHRWSPRVAVVDVARPREYVAAARSPRADGEELESRKAAAESLMLGLRT